MSVWFLVIAALMMAAALVCVALPLLRVGRRSGRARAPFVLAIALIFVLPLAALGLYAWFGTPSTLRPTSANDAADLAQATAELRVKLQHSPNHPEGWALLAQAYTSLGRAADARDALGRALQLKPDDPDLMAAWAESDAEVRADHRIQGEARALLQRTVALSPDHQRGLWLLGISDYQLGHYNDAVAHWQHLLPLLQAGSKLAQGVGAQIAMAQARAQGKTQAQAEAIAQTIAQTPTSVATTTVASAETASANTDAGDTPKAPVSVTLKVEVRLDSKLSSRISPNDTLFVFARAINGPPMPLAVARVSAASLPATVTLTDAMAMAPQLKLSSFPRVQVSARISKSGDALPHAGDLEARPVQTMTVPQKPIVLTIDHLH